jgi:hypothetical protein
VSCEQPLLGFTHGRPCNEVAVCLPCPSTSPQLPTPPELAAEDPPLPFFLGDQRVLNPAIIIGSDLGRVLEGSSPELLVMLLSTFRLSRFLVIPRGPAIHIILHVEVGGPGWPCWLACRSCNAEWMLAQVRHQLLPAVMLPLSHKLMLAPPLAGWAQGHLPGLPTGLPHT